MRIRYATRVPRDSKTISPIPSRPVLLQAVDLMIPYIRMYECVNLSDVGFEINRLIKETSEQSSLSSRIVDPDRNLLSQKTFD